MNPKTLTTSQLDYIFKGVPFKTAPRHHQLATLAWVLDKPRVSLWHDIGVGKSLTSLYAAQLWGCQKTLIISPNSMVIREGWKEQIEEHTDLDYAILQGTAKHRRTELKRRADIYVINYEGLQVLFANRVPDLNPRTKTKTKIEIDYQAIQDAGFDSVIVDECHHVSSPDANQTRIAHALSQQAQNTIIMTGSPISTSEANLWAEYLVLDDGASLGRNYYSFLKTHFSRGRYEWRITPSGREAILDRIAPVTLRYGREECDDLPDKTYQTRYVEMTAEQRRLTDAVINGLKLQLDRGTLKEQAILQQAGKLSQIAGGFLILDDGRIQRLKKNPKLIELGRVLDEIEGKVIVFHQYVEEGRVIEELLGKRRISFSSLRGETKDKAGQYARFREDPQVKVLVAHPASGGEGLNLQVASVAWFYSTGYTALQRDQAEGRIWRMGQYRPCLIGDIVVAGSVDERKLQITGDRADMVAGILDYVRRWRE